MLGFRRLAGLSPAKVLRTSTVSMAMWPTKFEEPLTSRKDIDEIRKTPEYERKVNVPIKAAVKSATCSLFMDPLLQRFINIVQLHSNAQVGENIYLETCRRIKVRPSSYHSSHLGLSHCHQEIQLSKYHAAAEGSRSDIELSPTVIIKGAIENCRPLMSLQKVKVGAVTYYVPTPISESRLVRQEGNFYNSN